MTGVAEERGSLVSTEGVVTLWWALIWAMNMCPCFAPIEKSTCIPLPKFPFSDHTLQTLTLQQIHWAQTMNVYINHASGYFSFHTKWTTRYFNFYPLGKFPFTFAFPGCLREGLLCCSCPLWGCTCISCRTISKSDLSLLPADQRELPMRPSVQVGREKVV